MWWLSMYCTRAVRPIIRYYLLLFHTHKVYRVNNVQNERENENDCSVDRWSRVRVCMCGDWVSVTNDVTNAHPLCDLLRITNTSRHENRQCSCLWAYRMAANVEYDVVLYSITLYGLRAVYNNNNNNNTTTTATNTRRRRKRKRKIQTTRERVMAKQLINCYVSILMCILYLYSDAVYISKNYLYTLYSVLHSLAVYNIVFMPSRWWVAVCIVYILESWSG